MGANDTARQAALDDAFRSWVYDAERSSSRHVAAFKGGADWQREQDRAVLEKLAEALHQHIGCTRWAFDETRRTADYEAIAEARRVLEGK